MTKIQSRNLICLLAWVLLPCLGGAGSAGASEISPLRDGYLNLLVGTSSALITQGNTTFAPVYGFSGGITLRQISSNFSDFGGYLINSGHNGAFLAELLSQYGAELSVRNAWDSIYLTARLGGATRSINMGGNGVSLYEDKDSTLSLGLHIGYELEFSENWALTSEAGATYVGSTRVNAMKQDPSIGAQFLVGLRLLF